MKIEGKEKKKRKKMVGASKNILRERIYETESCKRETEGNT